MPIFSSGTDEAGVRSPWGAGKPGRRDLFAPQVPLPTARESIRRGAGSDRAAGTGIALATAIALVWANWPGSHSYGTAWGATAPWSHPLGLDLSYRDWVNQGLMVGFFVLIGLEIRREVTIGELGSWRRA